MKTATKAGLKPKQRQLAVKEPNKKLQANQWQNTPQQNAFMEYWLDPSSPTFGNGYRSALKAGYSENYSIQVASKSPEWLTSFNKVSKMELTHIEQKLIQLINGEITRDQSNSPEDTRIRALELLAKVTGKLSDKNNIQVNIVTPILGGASRGKVIDQTPTTP